MASIIRAVAGVAGIPAGFPILLDDALRIVEPALAYLLELAVVPGRSHAADTVRTYAEHLHDWFDALEQSGLNWRAADEGTLAAYRNRMLESPSQHTGRPHARSTINGRLQTVCRFYTWAQRRGLIAELPFHAVELRRAVPRDRRMLAHLALRGGGIVWANALTLPQQGVIPRPLRGAELARLLDRLDQPYRLMAEWAVTTGLRRKELCALQMHQVPVVALDPEREPLVGMLVTQTKGDRPRLVYPPVRLIDRTRWYIGEERARALRAGRGSGPDHGPPASLFLGRDGRAPSRAAVSAAFGRAFRAAGLGGSLHTLRHTFAITLLAALQRQARVDPDLNPLKIVQVLLGHASLETTALYLRCVELHEGTLADSVAHLYGALVPDAAA